MNQELRKTNSTRTLINLNDCISDVARASDLVCGTALRDIHVKSKCSVPKNFSGSKSNVGNCSTARNDWECSNTMAERSARSKMLWQQKKSRLNELENMKFENEYSIVFRGLWAKKRQEDVWKTAVVFHRRRRFKDVYRKWSVCAAFVRQQEFDQVQMFERDRLCRKSLTALRDVAVSREDQFKVIRGRVKRAVSSSIFYAWKIFTIEYLRKMSVVRSRLLVGFWNQWKILLQLNMERDKTEYISSVKQKLMHIATEKLDNFFLNWEHRG